MRVLFCQPYPSAPTENRAPTGPQQAKNKKQKQEQNKTKTKTQKTQNKTKKHQPTRQNHTAVFRLICYYDKPNLLCQCRQRGSSYN